MRLENNTVMVIFGATGDLATNKLIPSMFKLHKLNMLPQDFQILAFSRRDYTNEDYFKYLKTFDEINQLSKSIQWKSFQQRIKYFKGDFKDPISYTNLAEYLNEIDKNIKACTNKVFYMAISPDLYEDVIKGLQNTHLKQICKSRSNIKIVLEKPFGKDLISFKLLNKSLLKHYSEDQIFRIDHYLGKETVQNIIKFRKNNPVFSNLWNPNQISQIKIKAYESTGIGSRGSYYDKYGQTRDMLQSHILQLLAITLMDLPKDENNENLIKGKVEILKNLTIEKETDIKIGQYSSGIVNGTKAKDYLKEDNVPSNSQTETYVKVKPTLMNKWKNLKIELETGKRLDQKLTQIELDFNFNNSSNKLIFRIQPNESIILELNVKKAYSTETQKVKMKYLYKDTSTENLPSAYEKILLNLIMQNSTTFVSSEELEASWKFTDQITKIIPNLKLLNYPSGINPENIKQIS